MAAARVILVEMWPRRPADGVAVPLRVIGGAAERADHFGVQWLPALSRMPRIVTRLGFDGRAFGAGAISTVGDIVIALGSAAVAPFAGYLWARAVVTIKTGPADGADGDFATLWTGRAADVSIAGKQMVVRLADPAEDLRRPVLAERFAGTGDLEGPAELKGRVKPRAWGPCENIPAILIDPAFEIYLLVAGQASIDAVKDGGVAFGVGPAAADLAALRAVAVPAGTVASVSGPQATLIRPWTRPTFTMTADVTASALTKPAEIAQAIVASRSAVPFAAGAVAAYDAAQPGPIGTYIDDERTLVDELDRIFAGLGSWWKLNTVGEIEVGQFEFGASATSFQREVAEVARQSVLMPTRQRLVGYRRNFRPLSDAEIAGALKSFNWRGDFDPVAVYEVNDAVRFAGAAHIATAKTAAGESPATTPAKWSLISQDGEPGADGLSVAELAIFRRAAAAPATPAGGSYDFGTQALTPPEAWSSAIPAGSEPVWSSRAVAAVQGVAGVDNALAWSEPVMLAQDGAGVDVIFTRSVTQPATPAPSAGVPAGWASDPATAPGAGPRWSSVGSRPNAGANWTWQTPVIIEGVTNWRGVWSASATYQAGDSVDFGGTNYLTAAQTVAGESPTTAPTKWQILAGQKLAGIESGAEVNRPTANLLGPRAMGITEIGGSLAANAFLLGSLAQPVRLAAMGLRDGEQRPVTISADMRRTVIGPVGGGDMTLRIRWFRSDFSVSREDVLVGNDLAFVRKSLSVTPPTDAVYFLPWAVIGGSPPFDSVGAVRDVMLNLGPTALDFQAPAGDPPNLWPLTDDVSLGKILAEITSTAAFRQSNSAPILLSDIGLVVGDRIGVSVRVVDSAPGTSSPRIRFWDDIAQTTFLGEGLDILAIRSNPVAGTTPVRTYREVTIPPGAVAMDVGGQWNGVSAAGTLRAGGIMLYRPNLNRCPQQVAPVAPGATVGAPQGTFVAGRPVEQVADATGRTLTAITPSGQSLASGITQLEIGGGTIRQLPIGAIRILARDGDTIVFNPPWMAPPAILPLMGGVNQFTALSGQAVDDIQFENLSASGFVLRAKLAQLAGAVTAITETGSVAESGGPSFRINKAQSGFPSDGRYTYRFTVNFGFTGHLFELYPASITLGYWLKTASGWVLKGSESFSGTQSTVTFERPVTTGDPVVGSLNEFGMSVIAGDGASLTAFEAIKYNAVAAPQKETKTPEGSSDIELLALGNVVGSG